jgi:hypothetical protein
MKAAIIAEGRGDLAVIANILKGSLGINKSELQFIRSEYEYDQTDCYQMDDSAFSNWTLVKAECQNKENIQTFLDLNENGFIVIHVDTAERCEIGYEVLQPLKNEQDPEDYCQILRENIVERIDQWLWGDFKDKVRYAVAIEEIEAWILATYIVFPTSTIVSPKEKLLYMLNKQLSKKDRNILRHADVFNKYLELSKGLNKPKSLFNALKQNKSLELFCNSLTNL